MGLLGLGTKLKNIKIPSKIPKFFFTYYNEETKQWSINGQVLNLRDDQEYYYNYPMMIEEMLEDPKRELALLRHLIQNDLWFFVRFVKGVPGFLSDGKTLFCDHPFWINRCADVQNGKDDYTMDLWGREHGKSTIITTGESVQLVLRNPEETVCILSYAAKAAITFLKEIKFLFEGSDILKTCFPDIVWKNPNQQSQQWSLESGLLLNRRSNAKEMSFEAYGLVDGQPTGRHYTRRYYDDVVTFDLVKTPSSMENVKEAFDMSQNLGTVDGKHRVIGTYYHYEDPLVYISKKIDEETEKPLYDIRTYPATVDGSFSGKSSYLPEKRLSKLKVDKKTFATQMLLQPNPPGMEKFYPSDLKIVRKAEIPRRLYKFILIDPAGSSVRKDKRGDDWAIWCVGVVPYRDEIGASDVYILDGCVEELDLHDALEEIKSMYVRNGKIRAIGVEKVGLSSAEIHITNALKASGKVVSANRGNLILLRPGGRAKDIRIESALSWPFRNGKIHICRDTVREPYIERLQMEMKKFPFWRDDAMDALSYLFDLLKDYRFPMYFNADTQDMEEREGRSGSKVRRARKDLRFDKSNSWMGV